MAKLTLSELQTELARRLKQIIASNDTTTLNNALYRAVRTIDGLGSFTFLQNNTKGTIYIDEDYIPVPSNLNYNKDISLYIRDFPPLKYVPYTELFKYGKVWNKIPEAFAYYYDATQPRLYLSAVADEDLPYKLYFSEFLIYPSATAYCQIPEEWYDIIIDVAEAQQKALYTMVDAENSAKYMVDRLKLFVAEFGIGDINVNLNDILNKGG